MELNRLFIVLIVGLTMLPGLCGAQLKTDSLERLVPALKDTQLVHLFNSLTKEYRGKDRARAFKYSNDAIALSKKIGFLRGEGQAYYYAGLLNADAQQFNQSLELFGKSLAARKKINDKQGMGMSYLKLSTINQILGKFDKTLDFAQQGLRLLREVNDEPGIGDALSCVGNAHLNIGNYDAALKYFTEALEIRERIHDIAVLAQSYASVGNLYYERHDQVRAERYLQRADSVAALTSDYATRALVDNNLAVIYEETGNYKKGLSYAEAAFSIREQQGNTKGMISTLSTWGRLLTQAGQYPAAEEKLLRAVQLADTSAGFMPEKHKIYSSLSKLYERMGDYKKAFNAAELHKKYYDSLYAIDVNEKMAEMEARFQTSVKDQEIQKQKFAITRRNYFILGISGLLLLGALLAYSYYRHFKLKKARELQVEVNRRQELASKGIIEAEERERKRIASDLHDGLGQLFSAVKMNLNIIAHNVQFRDDETAISYTNTMALVDESCREVRTISHQMMPNTLLKYGLASAVRDFINNIDTRRLKVNLEVHGLNERLDPNTETVLYRVLQETVNNVIKHARATSLDIQLSREPDGITATIEDNGRGFDVNAVEEQDGIGLKNIRTRVGFLKGTVEFDSLPGRGTVVSVWVPA